MFSSVSPLNAGRLTEKLPVFLLKISGVHTEALELCADSFTSLSESSDSVVTKGDLLDTSYIVYLTY